MRNSVLAATLAFVLAAPCTALAGEKKTIDVQSYSWGVSNAGSTARVGSPTIQKKHIGQPKYEDVSQGATGPTKPLNGKPMTTTVNPALQGNALQKGGVGSVKFSPEITRFKSGAGKIQ